MVVVGGGAVHGSVHKKQDLHHRYVNHTMANDSNAWKTLEAACALFSFLIRWSCSWPWSSMWWYLTLGINAMEGSVHMLQGAWGGDQSSEVQQCWGLHLVITEVVLKVLGPSPGHHWCGSQSVGAFTWSSLMWFSKCWGLHLVITDVVLKVLGSSPGHH